MNVVKCVFTASTTVPPLKQKGKIPVQETKTPESPKLKSKFTRIPKEKEPEPEVIKLKKVPVKPSEPEKQVVTHKAEVMRHHDPELTVHRLHDREDRDIITLGRTQRVFTAEEEMVQLGQFEEAERFAVVQKTEKEGWTRTPKPQKEEEPEVSNIDKKKITKLPKADEQKESVKLKPFEKSGKPEEEPQKLKLKKVPIKPKEHEKEVISKDEETRHYDTELTVQKLSDGEDREVITLGRTEQVLTTAVEESSELGHMEEPEKPEADNEKLRCIRTPKAQKDDKPEPDLTKKKVKKLPKKEEEQEVVTLKPFERQKPEAAAPSKAKREGEAKTDTEHTPFKKGETPQRDQPTAAIKNRKDEDVPLMSPKVTPDVSKDQKEMTQGKKVGQIPKDEEPTAADKFHEKPKIISAPDEEKEQVVLKPFAKVAKLEENQDKTSDEKKKPVDTQVPCRLPRDETPKELKEQLLRKVEKIAMPKKEDEKSQEKEEPAVPPKKPSPPGKKEAIPQKEVEKDIPHKKADILNKGIELKKTPSPRVGKDKVEEEKPLKPIEQLTKVELKKTPSPKVDKLKPAELEHALVEKKPSAEKVKRIPKTVSPKDSVESVILKKVPTKPSSGEASAPEKPGKGRVPLVKEVSPGAVQMKKVPTQPEEEVLEEEAEEMEGEEEEEAWGWELVPPEDWEGEGVDGALETPGIPGGKRGETKAHELLI